MLAVVACCRAKSPKRRKGWAHSSYAFEPVVGDVEAFRKTIWKGVAAAKSLSLVTLVLLQMFRRPVIDILKQVSVP